MTNLSEQSRATTVAAKKVNILLVDDREDNLSVLENLLEDLGQNLVKANSGRQALARLLEQDFAIILMDVRMPEMDGFETAALIRKRKRSCNTPIIFLTAVDDAPERIAHAYTVGAVDYLFKPFVPEILKSKVSVFLDLYRKNEQLRARAQELESLNEELLSFSYSISHDLRSPLRSIHRFAESLLEGFGDPLGPKGRDYAERIVRASARMDRLFEDLLSYSRLTRSELMHQPVDVKALFSEVAEQMAPEIEERKARVTFEGSVATLHADRVMLGQVLTNLLSNAIKFVAAGTEPCVTVRAEPRGRRVRISVQDNGIGIPPQYHSKLFRVFERLNSNYPGSGIGLAIVRKAVERMGGQVGVESAPGQGSRFWAELERGDGAA